MKLQVNGLKIAMVMVTAVAGVVLVNPSDATAAVRRTPIGIVVLSTRADLVTGDTALVQVTGVRSSTGSIQVLLNGASVRDEFAMRQNGQFEGLVTGLTLGRNVLAARLPDGAGARLVVTDHPISGPLFSGSNPGRASRATRMRNATTRRNIPTSTTHPVRPCVPNPPRCSPTKPIPWLSSVPVEVDLSRASRPMTRPTPQRPFRR
jgi:hypothetical protein